MGTHDSYHAEAEESQARQQQVQVELVATPSARQLQKRREEEDLAAVQMWTQELERELRTYRRWKWKNRLRWLFRIALLTLAIYLLVAGFQGGWWIWTLFFSVGAAADLRAGNRRQAVTELAKTRDPRAAGVLAVAWRDGDAEVRRVASGALKEILPRLHASDVVYFSADAMNAVVALLLSEDPALLLATLKALEQIGDEHVIPSVQGMRATWEKALPFIRDPQAREAYQRLVEAADSCLAATGERAQRHRQRQTLLRPAQNPGSPGETLLRPAGSTASPPAQLLRPANPDDPQPDP